MEIVWRLPPRPARGGLSPPKRFVVERRFRYLGGRVTVIRVPDPGSLSTLTVPPCSETHWLVLPDAIEVSAAQIAAFDARISHNNRPLQPTEGRDVSTTP